MSANTQDDGGTENAFQRRAHATTASWWNEAGNPGKRLACGTAGGTGHCPVWPVVLRGVATNRQTTKSDRLSHRDRRRINELRVGFRREALVSLIPIHRRGSAARVIFHSF